MNEATRARLSRALTWMLAAATLLVAALLINQCADIYLLGIAPSNLTETGVYIHPIYSREIVAESFAKIAWSVWLWLALLIAVLLTRQSACQAPIKPPVANQLALLQMRAETTPEMAQEQKKRKTVFIVCGAVCALCAMRVLLYMADLSHFASRDLEPVMGAMMLHIVPWNALAFLCVMIAEQMIYQSMLSEIDHAKKAPKRQPEPAKTQSTKARNITRAALYAAAVILLAAGMLNGGMRDVLVKAINICTECIGLG